MNVCGTAARFKQFSQLQNCRNVTCVSVSFEIQSSLATGACIFFVILIETFKTKAYTQSYQRGKEWLPPRTFHLKA